MRPTVPRLLVSALVLAGCSSEPSLGPAIERQVAKPRLATKDMADPEPEPQPEPDPTGAAGSSGGELSCQRSTFVLRPDVSNARDLGGVPLSPAGAVACGAVFRGPPLSLSDGGCQQFEGLAVRTVVDLRTESERLGNPEASCVTSRQVPAPLPVPYGLGPEDYLRDLNSTESMALVFHTFGDPSAYPIYFHCTYGRDRTGVVSALFLLALGATRETVMEEYLLSQPNVGAYPNALNAVLDDVERRGGATQVLHDLGISDDELAVMRSRATLD